MDDHDSQHRDFPGATRNRWARLYLWLAERLYSELACAYDLVSWGVSLGHWAAWRRLALDHIVGQRVLEIGFGTGSLLIEIAQRGFAVVGLELSPAMHRVAGRKMRRHSVEIPRVRGDARGLPFVDGCFDSVVVTFPSPFASNPRTMPEIARVLRSSNTQPGRLILILGVRTVRTGVSAAMESSRAAPAYRPSTPAHARAGSVRCDVQRLADLGGLSCRVVVERCGRSEAPVVIMEKRSW